MTRTISVQSSFLAGVLDPRAKARVETETYNNALLSGSNVVPSHLGGVKRRPGTGFIHKLPNKLSRIIPALVTAANGGTTANANDDTRSTLLTTTTPVGTTSPYVVVEYDLGSVSAVKFADVLGIISDQGTSTEFRIQYNVDNTAGWVNLGDAFPAVDYQDARDYRRAGVSARYWRVVKTGGTDMGSAVISIAGFNLWRETTDVSDVKVVSFEVSTEDRYVVALTDRSASIFKDRAYVDSVPMPYASADLTDVDATNDAETMILVHEDFEPWFLLRETATNFQSVPIVFDKVPDFDFNDADSPTPQVDTHVITLAGTWNEGDTFQIELEGARTGSIVYVGDSTSDEQAATAANIAREVQKLYSVPGFTGVSCVRTGIGEYTVAFGGASAGNYKQLSVSPVTGSGTATVVKTTTGVSRQEPVWSSTRGYPRTVAVFEGRLYFGGTRSRQQTLFGSQVNNILDFTTGEGLADEAIVVTLSGQQLNAITGLFGGRTLQVFTSGSELRYVKQAGQPIEPVDAPATQTQYGAAKVRPVAIDGSTLFVQRNRKSVRDFKYNYEEDAYDSLGVSSLAPHLLNGVRDLFVWNGSRVDEIGLVFAVNEDGTIAVLNTRKEAGVQAWTQWTTQGLFRSGAVVLEDIYLAAQRTLGGADGVYLEYVSEDLYTDCAVAATDSLRTTVTGLTHLNGTVCRAKGDGFVLASVTPSGGSALIERASLATEIGLDFVPIATPMPLNTLTPGRGWPNFMHRRRIVKVRAMVRETLGLLCNGRVLADRQFDIDRFDTPLRPYSGTFSIEESTNWDEDKDKLVTFSQVDPLPMTLLAIEVVLEGKE